MTEFYPNLWAVLGAGVAQFIIGAVYYSPAVFGNLWMKLGKKTKEDVKDANMVKIFGLSLVASIVTAYVLAHVLNFAQAVDVSMAIQGGFWMWLGFVATTLLTNVLYENQPFKLYLLNNGYHLLSLLVMSVMLVWWM